MMEGGNLGLVEALGKSSRLGIGGFWTEGVAGYVGVGTADGGIGGVGAAGEQTGEEACEAEGGNFEEVAFGSRGGQKGHELGSKVVHG
jgi:hypothetical protein